MKRIEAIQRIMEFAKDSAVISSCGMISREVYQVCDRPLNFYMMGSMGCELGFGIGIAMNRPDLKVIVISGDGSMLMSLGTLVLYDSLDLPNLKHYILDNKCHATTGGQPTVSRKAMFDVISPQTIVYRISAEKGDAPRIPLKPKQITERFKNAITRIA